MVIAADKNKYLFFTDFHAHLFKDFAKPYQDITDRFKQQLDILDEMLSRAEKEDRIVIFGGDLFHQRQMVDQRVLNRVWQVFVNHISVPVILLRGNHDSFNNSMTTVSSLDQFDALPNCHVVTKPEKLEVGAAIMYFMPYAEDIDYMKEVLNNFAEDAGKQSKPCFEVAHLGIDGAQEGKSSHRLASAFSVDDMHPKAYKLVYLGHYHHRQGLGTLGTMLYGGSTMQLTFSDEDETKGYDLVSADGVREFIKLNDQYPNFHSYETWTDEAQQAIDRGDYVKLKLNKDAVKTYQQSGEAGQENVRTEIKQEFKQETQLDLTAEDSPVTITQKYVKENCPDVTEEALEVIREVLN